MEAGWHPHCALPVIVVKALLVGEGNQCFLGEWEFGRIVRHSEQSGRASALGYVLGCQMELIHVGTRHGFHNYASRVRVEQLRDELIPVLPTLLAHREVSVIDLLINCNYHKLRVVVFGACLLPDFLYHTLKGGDVHFGKLRFDLGNAQALSVQKNQIRSLFVG